MTRLSRTYHAVSKIKLRQFGIYMNHCTAWLSFAVNGRECVLGRQVSTQRLEHSSGIAECQKRSK